MDGLTDPVDLGIVPNGVVSVVDQDDLVIRVHVVVSHLIGIKDARICALLSSKLLGRSLVVERRLNLMNTSIDTLTTGVTVVISGAHRIPLLNTHVVDEVALLGLVAQLPGSLQEGGSLLPVNLVPLPGLYYSESQDVSHDIALALPVDFSENLCKSHSGVKLFRRKIFTFENFVVGLVSGRRQYAYPTLPNISASQRLIRGCISICPAKSTDLG